MRLIWVELWAVAVYLVPVLVVLLVRARAERSLWQCALDLPLAVSLDLMLILALSRVVRLDYAALVSRVIWLAVGGALLVRRRREWGFPRALGRKPLAGAVLSAVVMVLPFSGISHRLNIWDRHWHGPLVASLGTQKNPFVNVFEPSSPLHYHFSGDVQAVALRAFSLDALSSYRALGVAHDLTLALVAICLFWLLAAFQQRSILIAALAGLVVVLQGPIPAAFDYDNMTYAHRLFVTVAYRPHVPLSALAMVGLVGSVVIRMLEKPRVPVSATFPIQLASAALLAVSDETSAGLLGMGLGVAWLLGPDVVAPGRAKSFFGLVAIAAAMLLPNLAFAASLAPGGPVQDVHWVHEARLASGSPHGGAIALASAEGASMFFRTIAPFAACVLALFGLALVRRDRRILVLALFAFGVSVACIALAVHLEFNGAPDESQRFFVAPYFASLVAVLACLPRFPRDSWLKFLAMAAAFAPAVIDGFWFLEQRARLDKTGYRQPELFDPSCREATGARLGLRGEPTYLDSALANHLLLSGCLGVFIPGLPGPPWPVKIYPIYDPKTELRELVPMLPQSDAPLPALCPRATPGDLVCAYARKKHACEPQGSEFERCSLSAEDRKALLGR